MSSAFDYMSFDHVMICVPNYDETIQWYRDKLDAAVEREWTVDELPDLKLAYLSIHGFRLEVVGSSKAETGMPVAYDFGESLRTTGIGHFCFRVDDVDAALTEMNNRGVPTFVDAADYPNVGRRVGFVKDNNGNIIEFAGSLKKTNSDRTIHNLSKVNMTTQSQLATDKTKIQQLTAQWIDAWSPKDKPFTGEGLENIFATGENEILVFDNFDNGVVVLHSLQEYLDTWIPVMQNFSYWKIELEDNLNISIDGDLAVTTFSWVGGGKTKDGQEVKARQYGTHTWKRFNGEWRLVHEHLTAG